MTAAHPSSTATEPAAHRPPLHSGALVEAFDRTAEAVPEDPALQAFGVDGVISWGNYAARARALSGWLAALGVARGAVCVSLYPTSATDQMLEQLAHSEAALRDFAGQIDAVYAGRGSEP
jgi:acyl-CoA synthetase (AMP-forming)/AMP-acid ligase II